MPDIEHVDKSAIGYVLERNKKYAIETDNELQDAYEEFRKGFSMWLDPSPVKSAVSKKRGNEDVEGNIECVLRSKGRHDNKSN